MGRSFPTLCSSVVSLKSQMYVFKTTLEEMPIPGSSSGSISKETVLYFSISSNAVLVVA